MFDKDLFEVLQNDAENSGPSYFSLLRLDEEVNWKEFCPIANKEGSLI